MTDRAAALAELRPYIERVRDFTGWDLSLIRARALDPEPPWDYEARARQLASNANSVLDIGTGGGEVYSRIAAGLPARFHACEEWIVNAHVAPQLLRPIGIDVVHCQTGEGRLPYRDAAFDLVLARHEAIDPGEVDRILAPGGTFLTQQVVPDAWREIRQYLPRATVFPDHWREYPEGFRRLGYHVTAQRHDYRVAFETLGDLVAMLLIAPWQVPGFDPGADLDALLALERALTTEQGIVLSDGRYTLVASKPA
ncbi:MAG: methyltransferase domain-containing protein [Dehalococcoidia bacterium]